MRLWYLADILVLVIIGVLCYTSQKRGFLKASYNGISGFLAILLVFNLHIPFQNYLEHSFVGDTIREKIEISVNQSINENQSQSTDEAISDMEMSGFLGGLVENVKKAQEEGFTQIKKGIAESVVDMLFPIVMQIISLILLFLIIRVLLWAIFLILKCIFEIQVLGFLDRALGFLGGLMSALLLIYVISLVIAVFVPADTLLKMEEGISLTYIYRHFYNNNILLELFI